MLNYSAKLDLLANQIWYGAKASYRIFSYLLWPFGALLYVISAIRRLLYRLGILESTQLPVPVVIVGNISVGGTGKTPLTIFLYEFLVEHGFTPGIISRGYGGICNQIPTLVDSRKTAIQVGDEALLIYQRTKSPLVIGKNRVEAAQKLLQKHPSCNIIISDDGLQHYALKRNAEIVVLD